jgi:hypothetical protein
MKQLLVKFYNFCLMFLSYIAVRIAKLEEPHFAHRFLIGENHCRISQVPAKQIRAMKTEVNSLLYY